MFSTYLHGCLYTEHTQNKFGPWSFLLTEEKHAFSKLQSEGRTKIKQSQNNRRLKVKAI